MLESTPCEENLFEMISEPAGLMGELEDIADTSFIHFIHLLEQFPATTTRDKTTTYRSSGYKSKALFLLMEPGAESSDSRIFGLSRHLSPVEKSLTNPRTPPPH